MSSVSTGSEGWMWLTFLRLAEPLIKRVDDVIASDGEVSRIRTLGPIVDEPANVMDYEDAERWDGLS
jgi:hypothetical protein